MIAAVRDAISVLAACMVTQRPPWVVASNHTSPKLLAILGQRHAWTQYR
jgi:hypothetical protein